jgi:hypothetical protein
MDRERFKSRVSWQSAKKAISSLQFDITMYVILVVIVFLVGEDEDSTIFDFLVSLVYLAPLFLIGQFLFRFRKQYRLLTENSEA